MSQPQDLEARRDALQDEKAALSKDLPKLKALAEARAGELSAARGRVSAEELLTLTERRNATRDMVADHEAEIRRLDTDLAELESTIAALQATQAHRTAKSSFEELKREAAEQLEEIIEQAEEGMRRYRAITREAEAKRKVAASREMFWPDDFSGYSSRQLAGFFKTLWKRTEENP